jgi:hypothetical protein
VLSLLVDSDTDPPYNKIVLRFRVGEPVGRQPVNRHLRDGLTFSGGRFLQGGSFVARSA